MKNIIKDYAEYIYAKFYTALDTKQLQQSKHN